MNASSLASVPGKPPRSVVAACLVIILFLCLFVLEITDSVVFHGQVARSTFFFPPAAVLLWGGLTRRRWAWYVARGAMLAGVIVFAATGVFGCLAANIKPADRRGLIIISFILSALLAAACAALGRPSARRLYHIGGNHE